MLHLKISPLPSKHLKNQFYSALTKCLMLLLLFFLYTPGYADDAKKTESIDTPTAERPKKRLLVVPYPFYNSTIGTGLGVAGIAEGYGQDRMLTVGSGLLSAEGTYMLFLMARNYQVPFFKRLTLDPQTSLARIENVQSFTMNNPNFPDGNAGSNASDKNNYIDADGDDFWFDFKMKFLLPIGNGKDNITQKIKVTNGIYASSESGGSVWNPFTSGRTYIELTPFYRNQSLDDEDTDIIQKTAGVDLALYYDNTDFTMNPSSGSAQKLYFSSDWGEFGSTRQWAVVGIELEKYFNLGPSKKARQRVLSFNFWSTDCLTWNDSHTKDGEVIYHRPPTYKGANLGGLFRLRGYPATRFNDRSAIYYGMEYRHTLLWNPLKNVTLGNRLDVDWLQLVGFSELGRVAPNWSLNELHTDMKWSLGAGLRIMVNNIILRADLASSEEDAMLQLFIGHPF